MYQRLLLLLSVLLISIAGMSQDVMTPTDGDYIYDRKAAFDNPNHTNPTPAGPGIMQKWVHDTSQTHNTRITGTWQTAFKSYRIGTLSFRLRFPNNYNPANKYPMVIFLHGAGEAASRSNKNNSIDSTNLIGDANRENQDQLFWGAQLFSSYIDAGQWNGFLLFPQNTVDSHGAGTEWDASTITPVNAILDKLAQYNGLDVDRVVSMGLSAGGLGTLNYANFFPQRIALGIPSSPERVQTEIVDIDRFLQIPLWMAAGGIDVGPDPANVFTFRDAWNSKGGNLYLTYYPTKGHQTWDTQWATTDINNKLIMINYWNSAHKAQPLVYGQLTQFCKDSAISAKMGITSGYSNYEWQYNNGSGYSTVLTGANANTYTATQLGTYRVRFQHSNGVWSDWTPNPVVISSIACALSDTLYKEHFDGTPNTYYSVFPGQNAPSTVYSSSYNYFNTTCQTGLFVNGTEVFTQDASGRQGGRFMLHNTTPTYRTFNNGTGKYDTSCPYFVGDQIWRLNDPVTGLAYNTDYLFSFYIGNQSTSIATSSPTPLAQIIPTINDQALTAVAAQTVSQGNVSWKKYTYLWNSGGYSFAQFALKNNTRTTFGGSGNDFAIDEISLTKFKPIAMPGFATKNVTLWTKANSLPGADGSPVSMWTNNDINGNPLQQLNTNIQPVLNNDAASNINFNPVVTYNNANARAMLVPGGFSGASSTTHNSVNAYIVARFANTTQDANLFTEAQSGGSNSKISAKISPSGIVNWMVGNTKAQDSIATPASTNEAGKPIIWSFSKSTAVTGSNNKLDIRKNGIVVASTNTPSTTTFAGNNTDFMTGRVTIGGNNNRGGFDGDVAEIIYILDSNITALKQRQIESYLAIKYGNTLGSTANPVSYVASDSLTNFWTGTSTYQNDVFGIGTDSLSGLVQSKSNSVNSGSGDGTGQFKKGNLVLATNTVLQDKQFLMIGSDNGALTQTVIQSGQAAAVAVGSTRLSRNWKVANTGNVGAVDLTFDTTGLLTLAGGSVVSNYALMIDDFGDAQYNHTLRFITATGVSGKKLIFANVLLNNNNAFTIITMKAALLPAIWLGFTAEAVNGNGLLNWKTSDEMNVDRYIVEHSFNGISFSVIGSVNATNISGVNNYTFTDNGLAAGTHYYRIRRVDLDGKSEYSDTKTIKITTAGANVQVRPNPVVGLTLQLAVSVQQNTKTSIQIMSVEGKMLLQQKATLTTGNNLVNLDVSNVPSGVYLVQVQLNDEVVTKKFVRQH